MRAIFVIAALAVAGCGDAAKPATDRPKGTIYITVNDEGSRVSLDADTVRGSRRERQGWVTSDHTANKSMEEGATKELIFANCDTTAFRVAASVSYARDGKMADNWSEGTNGPASSEYAVPDSIGADIVEALCRPAFDPPSVVE